MLQEPHQPESASLWAICGVTRHSWAWPSTKTPSAHPTSSALDSPTQTPPAPLHGSGCPRQVGWGLGITELPLGAWVPGSGGRPGWAAGAGVHPGGGSFHLGFAEQSSPTPPCLSERWHQRAHPSPGRRSCDWIIYSSSLTFLTRKYHTKGKVMKSHRSSAALTPHKEALVAEVGTKERDRCPLAPRCSPLPSRHSHARPLGHTRVLADTVACSLAHVRRL